MSLNSLKNNSLSIRDGEEHCNLTAAPDINQNETVDRVSHLSLHDLVPSAVFPPHAENSSSVLLSLTGEERQPLQTTVKQPLAERLSLGHADGDRTEEPNGRQGSSRPHHVDDNCSTSTSTSSSNTICPVSTRSGRARDKKSWRSSRQSPSRVSSSTATIGGSSSSCRSSVDDSDAGGGSSYERNHRSSSEEESSYTEEEEEEEEENPISCVPLPVPNASNMPQPISPSVLGRRNAVCALSHDPEKEEYHRRIIEKSVEEREQLRTLLLQNPLFSYLDEEALDTAVDAMKVEKHKKGTLVFEQGKEPTPKLFVILYGECRCSRSGKLLRVIGPGGYFGELELMYQQKSSVASVECTVDSTFYTLHRDHYQHLMHRRCLEQRSRYKQYIDTVPFLQKVPEYDRLRMADALTVKVYQAGELIIAYGQKCQELFFLMEGKTRVLGRSQDDVPMEIVVQEPGAVIGELEFLFDHNAVADVIVITPEAKVARISRHHFEAIMGPVQSCLLSFIAEVPIYDPYLNRSTNRKVHDEVTRLREKAKNLQDKCKARSVKSKARSTASREKNLPLDFGMPTSPVEEIQGSTVSRSPLAEDGGGRLENLLQQIDSEGAYVVRLPPHLLYYAELSATPTTTPLVPSGLPVFQGKSPLVDVGSSNRLSAYDGTCLSPSVEGLGTGGANHRGVNNSTPFAYFSMSEALKSSGVVLFCLREDGTVLSWHRKLEDLTGYPSSEAVGQSLYAFLQSEHEQLHLQQTIKTVLSSGILASHRSPLGSTTVDPRSRSYTSGVSMPSIPSVQKKTRTEQMTEFYVYHFSRQDGITHVRIELKVVMPKLEAHINSDVSSHRVVMIIGKEHVTNSSNLLSGSLDPCHLLREIRSTLANGSLGYEERLFSIADLIENYETIQRAQDVSKEGWQPVQLRQLIGKVIMDCVSDCMENNHTIHQRFENLTCEEACVDVNRLPRVLKHTMRIATHYTKNAEITITLSIREHAGMEFLAFIFTCDTAHLSPALEELLRELECRKGQKGHETSPRPAPPTPPTGGNQRLGLSGIMPSSPVDLAESFANADMPMGGLEVSHRNGSVTGMPFSGSQSNMIQGNAEIFSLRFRKHLRGIRHAIEQQGGTIRSSREGDQCHLMYLLPFIPAQDSSFSPPRTGMEDGVSGNFPRAMEPANTETAMLPFGGHMFASPVRENSSGASPSMVANGLPSSPPFLQSPMGAPGRCSSSAAATLSAATSVPDDTGKERLSFGEDGWSTNLAPAKADVILAQKKSKIETDHWKTSANSGNDSSDLLLSTAPQVSTCLTAAVNMNSSLSLGMAPFSPFQNSPLRQTDATLTQALSYTTLVAEENTVQRNLFCKYLWQRKHAVLSAVTFSEVERLSESVDILIIDVLQYTLQSSSTINFLQEKTHQLSIVVTGEMDKASQDAYIGAGFFVMPKPVHPSDFRSVMAKAEEKIIAFKRDAQSIAMIRRALSGFRMTSWDRGELLGKGTHGEVYKAISTITGGVMAVKEMRVGKNSDKLEQILTEISTMCSLQHPNIIHYFSCELSSEAAMVTNPLPAVQLPSPSSSPAPGMTTDSTEGLKSKSRLLLKTDSGSTPVNRYLRVFMEYASGGALREFLAKNGKLEFKLFQSLLHNVVSGLAYIHANHYVHGDIKTANILLTAQQVGKIGDFGSARRVLPGELLYNMEGSITYMSPECLSAGEIGDNGRKIGFSFPTDIWSLGVVAMEMITNSAPYSHVKGVTGPATLTQYLTSLKSDTPDLSPLFEYPPCVTEFIAACLQVVPSQRATAEDLLHYSIFHEGTDGETTSALKALRQAELRHIMSQYVAFQEPNEKFSFNGDQAVSGGDAKPDFAFQHKDDTDDFFDSDTTEEDEENEDEDSSENDDDVLRNTTNTNNEELLASLRASIHHGQSSRQSVMSDAGFLSPEISHQARPFSFCAPMYLSGNAEMDLHSHANTPVARQPSAMAGGLPNEGSSGEYFGGLAGMAPHRQKQLTPPPALPRRASYIVEDVRDPNALMHKVDSALQREASAQFRGGSSLRESNNRTSFSRFRNNLRPSKIATLMSNVASTMENAADEILTALVRPQRSAFPSTSVSETQTELNANVYPITVSHKRGYSSADPTTPCTPMLPTNHTLTLANLNNFEKTTNGGHGFPNSMQLSEHNRNTKASSDREVNVANQHAARNASVETPRCGDVTEAEATRRMRDPSLLPHSSSFSPHATAVSYTPRIGEGEGGSSLPISLDMGTGDQSSRMSTTVLMRTGGSGPQRNSGNVSHNNDPGASISMFGAFPVANEFAGQSGLRHTSPSNLFRAHHRVLQRRRAEAVYVAPAPRGRERSSIVDNADGFRVSRNDLNSADVSFVETPLDGKIDADRRQYSGTENVATPPPGLLRRARDFERHPKGGNAAAEKLLFSDHFADHYTPPKPRSAFSEAAMDSVESANAGSVNTNSRMGALLDDIQGMLNHLRTKDGGASSFLIRESSQGVFSHTTPQLLHPTRRYSSLMDSGQTSGTVEENAARRSPRAAAPALFSRSLGSEDGRASRRNSLNGGRPPLCRPDSANSSRIVAASSLPGGYTAGGLYDMSTNSDAGTPDTAVVGILQDFHSVLKNLVPAVPSSTSRQTPAFTGEEVDGLSPHEKPMAVSATTATPLENEDSPLAQPLRTLANFRPTSSDFYPDAMSI